MFNHSARPNNIDMVVGAIELYQKAAGEIVNHSQVWIGLIRTLILESNPKLDFRDGYNIAKLRNSLAYHLL